MNDSSDVRVKWTWFSCYKHHIKFRMTWFSFVTKPLSTLMSDPTPSALLQLNAPSLLLSIPLHRTPRRREGDMDILKLPTDDGLMQYLLNVTMEVRNHIDETHVHRSRIEEELLDVLRFSRKLQVICIFEHLFFQMWYREI